MGQPTGSLEQGAAGTLLGEWTRNSLMTRPAPAPQTRMPAHRALSIVGEPRCCQSTSNAR